MGQRLAAGCSDGSLKIWDLQDDKKPLQWQAHASTVHCVVFSPDSGCVASSSFSYGWKGEPTGGEVTDEMIRERAHEISQKEGAGTPEENWRRAEQELRGEPAAGGEPSQR